MTSTGDWGEIIDEAEVERFVGREQELSLFQNELSRARPRYLIFYISGQGGVGKTTLLNRYREFAKAFDFLLAGCTEQQRDIVTVMGHFAHQLSELHFPLKRFEKRFETYLLKVDEIANDPNAPQGSKYMIGKTLVRATYILGDLVPGLRKGLEYLPQEPVETRLSEWESYLAKKLSNKDDRLLVRDPIPILTSLFFEDLNEIAKDRKILLCFENFEETRQELEEWIGQFRDYKPSQNILLAIAGRDQPGAKWEPLQRVTMSISLDVFTEQEAQKFLDTYNITDVKRRAEILECSGRLPVLMGWLAGPSGNSSDPFMPTSEIVERFLRWVPEPVLRRAALWAAISRIFNLDVLKLLLDRQYQAIDEQSAFNWLCTMPFVQQVADGWQYHFVVRRMMLYYQRQESPQSYREMHTKLANFYNKSRYEQGFSDGSQWMGRQWYKATLSYVYHFLAAEPNKHWEEIMSLFVIAMWKRRDFAIEMIELLNFDDVHDELSDEQCAIIQMFTQQLDAINSGNLQDGFEMFDILCSVADLSSEAKGYALAYRGECYQLAGEWEKARRDFSGALQYLPQNAEIIVSRSMSNGLIGRYEEALKDFDQAITLDKTNAWAIANRGVIYRLLGRYEEALKNFDHAITLLDESVARDIIANRGLVHRLMGHYQEALYDFDHAIALGKQDAWAFGRRSMTYRLMGHYQEALEDAKRAVNRAEQDSWYLYRRAQLYMIIGQMHAYENDIQKAIKLAQASMDRSPDDWRTGFHLGLYHLIVGNFAQAEAVYKRLTLACPLWSELQVAENDLSEFLTAYPSNESAKRIHTHLLTRIASIVQSAESV